MPNVSKSDVIKLFGVLMISMLTLACSDVDFETSSNDPANSALGGGGPDDDRVIDVNDGCLTETCDEVSYDDSFSAPAVSNKVDVLLVIDTSGSMEQDLFHLGSRLSGFTQRLDSENLDWQLCLTTTNVGLDGMARDWVRSATQSLGTPVLTPQISDRSQVFSASIEKLMELKSDHGSEQGIASIYLALKSSQNSSCFRDDAAFASIIISDEDEASCGGRCQSGPDIEDSTNLALSRYTKQFSQLTDANLPALISKVITEDLRKDLPSTVHAITVREGDLACYQTQQNESTGRHAAFFGVEYAKMTRLMGGENGSVCSNDYTNELSKIADSIDSTRNSVNLRCSPIERPVVSFSDSQSRGFSLQGNKVIFAQAIPAQVQIRVQYKCFE